MFTHEVLQLVITYYDGKITIKMKPVSGGLFVRVNECEKRLLLYSIAFIAMAITPLFCSISPTL